jgi:hypothetical protein
MEVVVSPEAREFVSTHGGAVYVRSHRHRCCSGPLTLLDVTTEAPADAGGFAPVEAGDLTVRYDGDPADGPHQLTIELHGIVRRRLMAYWDGCAFRL